MNACTLDYRALEREWVGANECEAVQADAVVVLYVCMPCVQSTVVIAVCCTYHQVPPKCV